MFQLRDKDSQGRQSKVTQAKSQDSMSWEQTHNTKYSRLSVYTMLIPNLSRLMCAKTKGEKNYAYIIAHKGREPVT